MADTQRLQDFFAPDFENRRVWHSQELGAILEHQWEAPLEADLGGQPPGRARRLTMLCDADRLLLKSYGDVFNHTMPPIELLEMIKEFAKRNIADPDAALPHEIAELLYVLSVTVARIRCQRVITSQDDLTVRQNIELALSQPWITPPVAKLLQDGLTALKGSGSSGGDADDATRA